MRHYDPHDAWRKEVWRAVETAVDRGADLLTVLKEVRDCFAETHEDRARAARKIEVTA